MAVHLGANGHAKVEHRPVQATAHARQRDRSAQQQGAAFHLPRLGLSLGLVGRVCIALGADRTAGGSMASSSSTSWEHCWGAGGTASSLRRVAAGVGLTLLLR